jgi:hypothetical protein
MDSDKIFEAVQIALMIAVVILLIASINIINDLK